MLELIFENKIEPFVLLNLILLSKTKNEQLKTMQESNNKNNSRPFKRLSRPLAFPAPSFVTWHREIIGRAGKRIFSFIQEETLEARMLGGNAF